MNTRNSGRRFLVAAAALSVAGPSAWADTTETKSGGDWFDGGMWTNGVPSALDVATISAGSTVNIQKPGAGASVLYNNGIINVMVGDPPSMQSGSLAVGLQLVVGQSSTGQVKLSTGGRAFTTNVVLGYYPGSSGIVTVDGAPNLNGDRSAWTNSGEFIVGGSGFGPANGAVLVNNGGQMTTANTSVGSGASTGTVDLNNSTWTNTNLYKVGDGGTLGSLSITNHATLNTLTGVIGYGSGGSGTLSDTRGTAFIDRATWNNTGDFYVGGYARGQLDVVYGGVVKSATGYVGYGAGSVGTATFSESAWTNTGALYVGLYGDGSLTINQGASVTSAQGILGRYGQAKGAVAVDNGTWTNAGDLFVGHGVTGLPDTHPEGQLVVRNGGSVSSVSGFIGYGAGSKGTVEVKGVNDLGKASSWTMLGELHVGQSGIGTLTISAGGVVKSAVTYLGPEGAAPGGGTLNLNGTAAARGVLETSQVLRGQGSLFVDGGILRATTDQPGFLRNFGGVAVLANGVFVDSNGHQIGIDTTLTGPWGLTKLGQGTLDLHGLSFLGGLSTVDAGKLLINGNFTGNLQVNAGATLGGSGQINGSVNVLPGAVLSPGNSPGTLTLGSLTLGQDAHLIIELGALSDHLTINGDLTLDGFIDFIGDPVFYANGPLPSFISYTGTLIDHGIVIGTLPDGVDQQAFALDFSTPGVVGVRLGEGSGTPTAVPEPSTTALMVLGVGMLLVRRKGRQAPGTREGIGHRLNVMAALMRAHCVKLRIWVAGSSVAMGASLLTACADVPAYETPHVDAAPSTQALKALPRKPGELVSVSIYEFRSAVTEIPARGTTDMFKTALVQSGQFRVVERARLNEGVIREKQVNAAGLSSGKSAKEKLVDAKYVFEGAITQANAGETQRSGAIGIAGAQVGGSTNRDVIGIDVRVVDVASGTIVAVVTVHKAIASDSTNVSGIGSLIGTVLGQKGKSSAYVPDVQLQQQRKQSVDVALRAAIDQAVVELANRFPH